MSDDLERVSTGVVTTVQLNEQAPVRLVIWDGTPHTTDGGKMFISPNAPVAKPILDALAGEVREFNARRLLHVRIISIEFEGA